MNILENLLLVTKYLEKSTVNNFKKKFPYFFMIGNLQESDYKTLLYNYLISNHSAGNKNSQAVFINNDKNFSLMINEEDHFRIQYFLPGLQFKKIWSSINKFDDYLMSLVHFAYDKEFGFVTSSLANTGTGMRCSAMVHLIGLSLTGKMKCVKKAAKELSMTIRGICGEGSKNYGYIFQISNKGSVGETEKQIIERCEKFIKILNDYEINARNQLLVEENALITDKIARAYGILKNCYTIKEGESFELLSLLRLGCSYGMIEKLKIHDIDCFLRQIQTFSGADNEQAIDIVRAEHIINLLNTQ
ncbi:ATP--guanido phosphotransferase [Lentisphaerota bacterium WC36G]|nr:ATP--guanido phosphotransferase [Lentisphaerae bacterium WC36]